MTEVNEINDLRSLSEIRLLWHSLLNETPRAGFLSTYEWLTSYWRHFGESCRLRVLVVSAAGQTVGILPLCVMPRRHRVGLIRELTYPLDNWGTFYGAIGKHPTATLLAAMRHVADSPRDWDRIHLPSLAMDSMDHGRTQSAMRQVGFQTSCSVTGKDSSIDLSRFANWDDYLASRPRKVRHELRRHIRRIGEWGKLELIRHRPVPRTHGDGNPAWDLYDQCEQLAQSTWQATSTDGNTLCTPRFVSFYRDAHAAASRLGMADMAVLKLSGRPVAFWYGYHFQGRVMGLRMGYDCHTPIGGVGTTLLSHLISDSLDRGDHTLELGVGGEKYKHRLRTHEEKVYRLTHTPAAAVRPQLLRAAHWMRSRVATRA